jgi:hypothetical protein
LVTVLARGHDARRAVRGQERRQVVHVHDQPAARPQDPGDLVQDGAWPAPSTGLAARPPRTGTESHLALLRDAVAGLLG